MKIKDDLLRVIPSTAAENDLNFFLAVLSEINYVISQTYGPEAGYVAQYDPDTGGFTYTKDGLTTLNNLSFKDPADVYVLNMIKLLAMRIKSTSGDGSTTATKLLYYMIKHAKELGLSTDAKQFKAFRINTPKSMEKLLTLFAEEMKNHIKHEASYETLRDAAYISLNNDDSLMEPIIELLDHMKKNKAPIDDSLQIEAFRSINDTTTVDYNPGYVLGVKSFAIDTTLTEIENAKIIMIPNNFTLDYIRFILKDITAMAQSLSNQIKIIFLVNSMDDNTKIYFKEMLREYQTKDQELLFDVIELAAGYNFSDNRLEDISYLLNTNPISLQGYVEKRADFDKDNPTEIDNQDTTQIVKWRAITENGVKDYKYGLREFGRLYFENLKNSFYCNIKVTPNVGLTVSVAKASLETQTEEYKTRFKRHLDGLKEATKAKDKDIAQDAVNRLFYLKDNFYVIHVARRIGDNERIYTAYKDATKALSAIAKHGYYMGGSVGAYQVISAINKKYTENDHLKTLLNIVEKSIVSVIQDLKAEFNDKPIEEILEKHININENAIDGTPVLIPVQTDLVMIPSTLFLFSNIFASLLIEFTNTHDTGRFKMVSMEIQKLISDTMKVVEEVEEKEIPLDEDKFDSIMPIEKIVEPSIEEDTFTEEDYEKDAFDETHFEDEGMDEEIEEEFEEDSQSDQDEDIDNVDFEDESEDNDYEDENVEVEYEDDESEDEDLDELEESDEEYVEDTDDSFISMESYMNMDEIEDDDIEETAEEEFIDDDNDISYAMLADEVYESIETAPKKVEVDRPMTLEERLAEEEKRVALKEAADAMTFASFEKINDKDGHTKDYGKYGDYVSIDYNRIDD